MQKAAVNDNYSGSWRSRFEDESRAERVGNEESDSETQPWQTARNKRRRINTGSVDSETFACLSPDEKMSVIFAKLSNIELANNSRQSETSQLKSAIANTTEQVKRVETITDQHTSKLKMLAYKTIDIEMKLRSKHLIFYNLAEVRNEIGMEVARDFMYDALDIDPSEVYIERAVRLGKIYTRPGQQNQVRRRPLLVAFRDYYDIDTILQEAPRLKGTRFAIDKDYPPEVATARKRLWPKFKHLRQTTRAKISLDFPAKLVVNGRVVDDEFPEWSRVIAESRTSGFSFIKDFPITKTSQAERRKHRTYSDETVMDSVKNLSRSSSVTTEAEDSDPSESEDMSQSVFKTNTLNNSNTPAMYVTERGNQPVEREDEPRPQRFRHTQRETGRPMDGKCADDVSTPVRQQTSQPSSTAYRDACVKSSARADASGSPSAENQKRMSPQAATNNIQ